jgi:ferredoxin-type protein NapH
VVGEDKNFAQIIAETQGTMWSARIAGVSLTDPLAGLEAIVSSRAFYRPLIYSLLIPIAITLILGRVFCGWICPMNTLLELVDRGRRLLGWLELRERDVRFSLNNKYVMLGCAVGFVAFTGVPFLAMVYPPAVLSREMHMLVFGNAVGAGVYLVLAVCAFELFVSKRWWCRYVCPGGAVYSLLGRFRVLRIRRDEDRCTQCGDCVRICQFDLRPMLVTTTGMECTNCAACVAGCEQNALRYQITLPNPRGGGTPTTRDSQPVTTPAADETAEVSPPSTDVALSTIHRASVLVIAAILLSANTASAHHILGLPHYSYKENYPQAPTLEYPATTGPYDVLMTSYPGAPVPGEAATIAFYIKNRVTGQPYDEPVTVQVLKTTTFGSNEVVHEPATHNPFDNQHKYTIAFPEDHEYIVELTMNVEGQEEVIPFLIVAGEPTATKSIVIAIFGGLAAFLVVVRAIKVKRDRRAAMVERTD